MDIPGYHNYTLAHDWDKAKMLQKQSPKLSFFEKRAKCLKEICKRFYVQNSKVRQELLSS